MTTPPPAPQRTISLPEAARPMPELAATAVTRLRVLGTHEEFELDPRGSVWVIGQAPHCQICLTDRHVSQVHGSFLRQPDGHLLLVDRSKNGTYVNGTRIERSLVFDGYHLQFGTTHMVAVSEQSRYDLTPIERLVGESPSWAVAREDALALADTRTHILLLGEPGTGKRTLAQAIHLASMHRGHRLIELNLAALHPGERGAALEAATRAESGSTVLVRHLEVLEAEGRQACLRLLGTMDRSGDAFVRVIATVSGAPTLMAPQWEAIRMACPILVVPPLWQRIGDFNALVLMLLRDLSPGRRVELEAMDTVRLAGLDWPENVRTLRQTLLRLLTTDPGPLRLGALWPTDDDGLRAVHRALHRAIAETGTRRNAADLLGLPWSSFNRWAKACDLPGGHAK